MDHGPVGPRRFKEAGEGGDEAAGNRQAPQPRALATGLDTLARLLEAYSSQKEENRYNFF